VQTKCLLALAATSLCFWGLATAQAVAGGVEVAPAGSQRVESPPGRIVTAVFRVTNDTDRLRELEGRVELPEEWKLITGRVPFELGPGASAIRLASFCVPLVAPAGRYDVTYSVVDRVSSSIIDLYTVTVVVLPVARLEVQLLEAPEYVVAGDQYVLAFVILNQGNVARTVAVTVESGDDYPAAADPGRFELKPSESRTVAVTVTTDPALHRQIKHRVHLIAAAGDLGGEPVAAEATSWVDIIPRITGVEDPFHRLPVDVTVRATFGDDSGESGFGLQTEISGSGTLDEAGRHHIDFAFRGPDIYDESLFGRRDRYRLSYWTDEYELHLGDRGYSLSPLTELYTYGRGAEGLVNLDDFTVGAYYHESRWTTPKEKQAAAYIKYNLSGEQYIGLNYLRKEGLATFARETSGEDAEDDILSLRGEFEPLTNVDLDLEYAWGQRCLETATNDDTAYRAKVSGFHDWGAYEFIVIHAEPDFPGYYRDMDFKSGELTVPLLETFEFRADYRRQENNLDREPSLYYAALVQFYRLGFDCGPWAETTFGLDYKNMKREDLLAARRFDYEDDTIEVEAKKRFKDLSIGLSGELGHRTDRRYEDVSDLQRYRLAARFTPRGAGQYQGYLEYQHVSGKSGGNGESMTAGLSLSLDLAEDTSFWLDARTTDDSRGGMYGDHDVLEMKLAHTLKNESTLAVRGRYASWTGLAKVKETAVLVEYTVPFDVPTSRKTTTGTIKGLVYDVATAQGIADAVLRLNGTTAVSDRKGRFVFPSLKPGTYHLRVDAAGIGLDKVTAQPSPVEITVRGGQEREVRIGITRGAALTGRVVVYRAANGNHANGTRGNGNGEFYLEGPPNGAESAVANGPTTPGAERKLVEAYGLANVVVEARANSEVLRRVTDRKGRFAFEAIRPGQWKLKVYDAGLPEYHYLEESEFDLILAPGERKAIDIRVLPERRPIRIIRDGGVIEEEKGE